MNNCMMQINKLIRGNTNDIIQIAIVSVLRRNHHLRHLHRRSFLRSLFLGRSIRFQRRNSRQLIGVVRNSTLLITGKIIIYRQGSNFLLFLQEGTGNIDHRQVEGVINISRQGINRPIEYKNKKS